VVQFENFEFIKFENEQQWGCLVIVFEIELRQGIDLKNKLIKVNGSFLRQSHQLKHPNFKQERVCHSF
jgi:hypothetical protein